MPPFDFVFAGGGVAGLSLAHALACSPLGGSSILIIDQGGSSDHALSFWSARPTPFDDCIARSWDRLRFRSEDFDSVIELGDYRYHTLRSAAFSASVRRKLASLPNVEFLEAAVGRVEDSAGGARVWAGGREYAAKWAFDSRFRLADFKPDTTRCCSLRQHFKGWEIETDAPAFDPLTPTLFDLRLPQKNELRFFYVLPYSERHALVEFVLLGPDDYDEALRTYIEETLGIRDYRILGREGGVTPLSDAPFPRRAGEHVLNIGIRGGRVKPSAGYAFTRIQRDSQAIVASLLQRGHPFAIPVDSRLYRFCDAALLRIMQAHGADVKPIYTAMFKNNPIRRVFRFLDEEASFSDNLALALSLPLHYFWGAMFQSAMINFGIPRRSV